MRVRVTVNPDAIPLKQFITLRRQFALYSCVLET